MAGTLTPTPFQTVFDTDGVAVSGALIYTYVGGTTTNATTYADASLATANANPIVADSAGRFVAYLPAGGNFKFLYKTAAGATIEEQDNILSVPGAAVNLDIEGTVGQAVTAGQVCYLSTGAEATPLTAGLWYLTDADFAPTSTTCQSIGVAVSAIAINTAGTIRLAGTATTATAVVIGSTYYVSATAGAITATAPALSRTVGVALTTSTLLLAATTAVVTPAGSNTQVQFNDSGVLGGDSGFTFIKATDAVAIAGATTVGGTLGVTGLITSTAGISGGPATHTTGSFSSTVATGALTVTGAATVSTTLGVTGATTLSSTLGVTGLITSTGGITGGASSHTTGAFSSTVTGGTYNGQTISSAANFTGTVAVSGLTTLSATGDHWNKGSLSLGPAQSASIGAGDLSVARSATTAYLNFGSNGSVNLALASSVLTLNGATLTVSGFGTSSFSAGGTGENSLEIKNSSAGTTNIGALYASADTAKLVMRSYASTYTTSTYDVQNGAALVTGASTTGGLSIAAINASGAIRFYSGGTTLRGQLSAAGNLLLNTTLDSAGLMVSTPGTSKDAVGLINSTNLYTSYFVNFYNYLNVSAGSIQHTSASVVAYTSVSDQRIKRDLGLATDLSGLRAIRVHDFQWTTDGALDRNVFAQEAYAAYPGRAVIPGRLPNGDLDLDPNAITKMWTVEKAGYVPDLIVGWQQHDATIAHLTTLNTQLAARIAALETKDH